MNDGAVAASFVEGYALFFKNGKVVDHDSAYFTDNDSEIKPGKSIMKELSTREDYDSYELYFDGMGR